jgi:hypothetical protein
LRESLGLICLELFTSRLPEAERLLSEGPRDGSVADGQRFGDRLDLLVNRPEEAKRIITERMAAGLDIAEPRSDTPPLENVFVATLRQLGEEIHAVPFRRRRDHGRLHGQVAIGARGLTKEFGDLGLSSSLRHLQPAVVGDELSVRDGGRDHADGAQALEGQGHQSRAAAIEPAVGLGPEPTFVRPGAR